MRAKNMVDFISDLLEGLPQYLLRIALKKSSCWNIRNLVWKLSGKLMWSTFRHLSLLMIKAMISSPSGCLDWLWYLLFFEAIAYWSWISGATYYFNFLLKLNCICIFLYVMKPILINEISSLSSLKNQNYFAQCK